MIVQHFVPILRWNSTYRVFEFVYGSSDNAETHIPNLDTVDLLTNATPGIQNVHLQQCVTGERVMMHRDNYAREIERRQYEAKRAKRDAR